MRVVKGVEYCTLKPHLLIARVCHLARDGAGQGGAVVRVVQGATLPCLPLQVPSAIMFQKQKLLTPAVHFRASTPERAEVKLTMPTSPNLSYRCIGTRFSAQLCS